MDYFYALIAMIGSIKAISYGIWVKKHGNIVGAVFIIALSLISVGLPIYKIVASP